MTPTTMTAEEAQAKRESFFTKELAGFDEFRSDCEALSQEFKHLKIENVNDKKGFDEVHRAEQTIKRKRLEIDKLGKATRADSNAFSQAVIERVKELLAIMEPEEKRLKEAKKAITDEKERIKKEKEAEAEKKRVERFNKMRDLGMVYCDARFYISADLQKYSDRDIGFWSITVKDLEKKTEAEYIAFSESISQIFDQINEKKKAEEDEAKRKKAEADRKIKEEQEAEQARLDEQKRVQEEAQKKIDEDLKRIEEAKELESLDKKDGGVVETVRDLQLDKIMKENEANEISKGKIKEWKEREKFDEKIHELRYGTDGLEIWTKPQLISIFREL